MIDEVLKVRKVTNGLKLNIKQDRDYDTVKYCILKKLDELSNFLNQGCAKVEIIGKEFSEGQKRELSSVIRTYYNVGGVEFRVTEYNDVLPDAGDAAGGGQKKAAAERTSVFKMERIKSGMVLESGGDMTIVGDVEFGAKLIAGGNICVLGALRGEAFAGVYGDNGVIIAANVFEPSKLRIAGYVGIAPKDNKSIGVPEYAHVSDGGIVIEPVEQVSAFDDDERQRGIINSIKRFFTYDH